VASSPSAAVVSREELESRIACVRSSCVDPAAGIYGPGSVSWRIGKEGILFLGGGRAALLQLAHPWVAHAVNQHSHARHDPLGRFQRTFDAVFAMVFGDLDRALRSARRVHAIHERVQGALDEDVGAFARGDAYRANEAHALLWVHATLLDSAIQIYDLVVRPLSDSERNDYYEESKRFASLFGIPDSVLPADYAAFRRYFDEMLASDVICVGRPALELRRFLFASKNRARRTLFRWLELMTAGLMPERLRDELELAFGAREERWFRASLAALRFTYPHIPPRLRYVPAYVAARRRLAGKRGPDRVGAWLERMTLFAIDSGANEKSQRDA
jgi:uncharacterized protein (DUF2236 family)